MSIRLAILLCCLGCLLNVYAQVSKGSFGLVTTDPICVQCDYATVQWYGGIAPYVLSVSGQKNTYKLTNVGITSTNQMKWHVNFPTGTRLWFQLRDANDTDIYTNIATVAASPDASCVNVTNPLVTDSSSASSLLSTASSSASASAADASNTSDPKSTSSHVPTGPIAGGIAAGVIALLLLIILALWFRRRSRRTRSMVGSKSDLDLNEDRNGVIVEPFLQTAEMSQSNTHLTDQPISMKVRGNSSGASSATHLHVSNAGPSTAVPSSPASQSADETPVSTSRPGATRGKHTRMEPESVGPVQESDAGVRLMGGMRREEPTTLPPAYDSSWRE